MENVAHVVGTLANVPIPAITDILWDQQRDFLKRASSKFRIIKKYTGNLKEFNHEDIQGIYFEGGRDFKNKKINNNLLIE